MKTKELRQALTWELEAWMEPSDQELMKIQDWAWEEWVWEWYWSKETEYCDREVVIWREAILRQWGPQKIQEWIEQSRKRRGAKDEAARSGWRIPLRKNKNKERLNSIEQHLPLRLAEFLEIQDLSLINNRWRLQKALLGSVESHEDWIDWSRVLLEIMDSGFERRIVWGGIERCRLNLKGVQQWKAENEWEHALKEEGIIMGQRWENLLQNDLNRFGGDWKELGVRLEEKSEGEKKEEIQEIKKHFEAKNNELYWRSHTGIEDQNLEYWIEKKWSVWEESDTTSLQARLAAGMRNKTEGFTALSRYWLDLMDRYPKQEDQQVLWEWAQERLKEGGLSELCILNKYRRIKKTGDLGLKIVWESNREVSDDIIKAKVKNEALQKEIQRELAAHVERRFKRDWMAAAESETRDKIIESHLQREDVRGVEVLRMLDGKWGVSAQDWIQGFHRLFKKRKALESYEVMMIEKLGVEGWRKWKRQDPGPQEQKLLRVEEQEMTYLEVDSGWTNKVWGTFNERQERENFKQSPQDWKREVIRNGIAQIMIGMRLRGKVEGFLSHVYPDFESRNEEKEVLKIREEFGKEDLEKWIEAVEDWRNKEKKRIEKKALMGSVKKKETLKKYRVEDQEVWAEVERDRKNQVDHYWKRKERLMLNSMGWEVIREAISEVDWKVQDWGEVKSRVAKMFGGLLLQAWSGGRGLMNRNARDWFQWGEDDSKGIESAVKRWEEARANSAIVKAMEISEWEVLRAWTEEKELSRQLNDKNHKDKMEAKTGEKKKRL